MCGLIGQFLRLGGAMELAPLQRTLDHMRPCGPDAEGVWQETGFCPETWGDRSSGILPVDGAPVVGLIELTTYLRNQLLRDVSPSLWAFAPFPNKHLLAEAPDRPLPDALINRRKAGFSIPVQCWLNDLGRVGDSAGGSRRWAWEVARAYGEGSQ